MPVSQQGPPGSRPFLSCPVQPVELGLQQRALLPELPPHMLAPPRAGQHPPLMSLLLMGLLLLPQHTVQQHFEGWGPDWLALTDD